MTVVFAAISCGVGLAAFLITLLAMFRKMVDQNATMRTTLGFVSESLNKLTINVESKFEKMDGKIDAIRNTQTRR